MAQIRIDAGGTFLPICNGCGWRGLPCLDRGEALREGRHHELRAHPGDENALQALAHWTRRHA